MNTGQRAPVGGFWDKEPGDQAFFFESEQCGCVQKSPLCDNSLMKRSGRVAVEIAVGCIARGVRV